MTKETRTDDGNRKPGSVTVAADHAEAKKTAQTHNFGAPVKNDKPAATDNARAKK